VKRPEKITFPEMRATGVLGLLIYCLRPLQNCSSILFSAGPSFINGIAHSRCLNRKNPSRKPVAVG
jgi:hypothetical protein